MVFCTFKRSGSTADRWSMHKPCVHAVALLTALLAPISVSADEGDEAGSIEIELGYIMKDAGEAGREHTTPFMLSIGLQPWMQVQIGSNGYTYRPEAQFFDDLMLGFKFRLTEQSAYLPTVAFSALLSVPTTPDQLGYAPSYDALFGLYLTKDATPWLSFDLIANLNIWHIDDVPLRQLAGALSANFALPQDFSANVGVYAMTGADPYSGKDAGLQVGVGWAPAPWLTVDAIGDLALMKDVRAYSVSAGLTITPPLRLY